MFTKIKEIIEIPFRYLLVNGIRSKYLSLEQ